MGAPGSGYSTRLGSQVPVLLPGTRQEESGQGNSHLSCRHHPVCHQGRSFVFYRGSLLGRVYNEGHSHHLPFPPSGGHGINSIRMVCGNSASGPS